MIHDRQGLKDENGIDVLLPPSSFSQESCKLDIYCWTRRHRRMKCTLFSVERLLQIHVWQTTPSWYFRELLSINSVRVFGLFSSILMLSFFSTKHVALFLPSVLSSNSFRHEKGNCVQQEYKSLFRNHKNVLVYEKKLGFFFSWVCFVSFDLNRTWNGLKERENERSLLHNHVTFMQSSSGERKRRGSRLELQGRRGRKSCLSFSFLILYLFLWVCSYWLMLVKERRRYPFAWHINKS